MFKAPISCIAAVVVLFVLSMNCATAAPGDAMKDAAQVLKAAGPRIGLCVYLGAGRGLTAALAKSREMPVHGLAFDDAALGRARAEIAALNVPGRAMVEKLAGKSLPYLSSLASVIVVEDMTALTAQGISRDEVLRVLAPGGALCVKQGGKWTASVKPRPKGMGEWTHPHHGADGNLVSNEQTLTFPIGLRWIAGTPFARGGFASCAPTRAVVLAGGRCFTVTIDGLPSKKGGAKLIARDAFSGFPLWRINCEGTYSRAQLDWRNTWPLAATDKRVYVRRKNELLIVDAATGEVRSAHPTKYEPRRLVLTGKSVVVASWEKMVLSNPKDGYENDGIRAVWWPAGAGSVEAFDADTGKPRWSLPLTALTLVASEKTAYVLTHKGNPPTERTVVAIDLATGKEKWRVPHTRFGELADTCLNFAGPGCAVVSKTKAKGKRGVFVLSEVDGKVLHHIPGTMARSIVGGELWCSDGRYDLKTGKKTPGPGLGKTYAGVNIVGGCVPPVVVGGGRMITSSRGGSFTQLPDDPKKRPTRQKYSGARGACIQGMVPANGMLYTAQNNCACVPAQVGGFLAIGPTAAAPAAAEFIKPRPVEKGPAFGATGPAASKGDWPTYRQNVERSGGSSAALPKTLKLLWKKQCVTPGQGRFAASWHARIATPQPLTAPIIAAGMAIIAGLDTGEMIALNASTGAPMWRTLLGSRIDSPPTYYKGLCLVGCRDGWVYALRAKDGVLAYRVRIAPAERRMVAYGLVESVWPASGAILVYDGVAFATAGRSTRAGGGIALVAFKPETGETVWTKHMGGKLARLTDAVAIRDGELAWHWLRLDPKTGKDWPLAQKFYNMFGMIDGSWSGGYGKRSGRGFSLGKACSSMMAWNDRLVVLPRSAVLREKVEAPKPPPKAKAKHPDRIKAADIAWNLKLKPHVAWSRINAMAVSGNTAFYAGSVYKWMRSSNFEGSFVWMKSMADGKTQQERIKLPARPAYDGFAIANGRVYLALQDGTLLCWGE
jgi:outer membrane protein assembly factor BamB